ncbi:MAG: hypothetical protein ABI402_10600 [Ferruginibacter sp.]
MLRKILIIVLSIALILELFLTCSAFFATEATMQKFGVVLNSNTAFLAYIVAWCLLFISLICGLAIYQVTNKKSYAAICYLLGFWWIGIGVGIYVAFGKPDNLLLDSFKGCVIVILTYITIRKGNR